MGKWTPAEADTLQQMKADHVDNAIIAMVLGRSELSVMAKLAALARDTDGSGEAGETAKQGSTRRATAGAEGIAHPPQDPSS